MPEVRDDPRQVLTLLNSLGFVGITGEQLKAFMKDLKMYRKIKDRERQQWKDEMKRRILEKQRAELSKLLTSPSSPDIPQQPDDPVVEIKIQCVSDSDTTTEAENEVTTIMTHKTRPQPQGERNAPINSVDVDSRSRTRGKTISEVKPSRNVRTVTPPRPASAPDLSKLEPRASRSKSSSSEPTKIQESSRNPSRCSSRSQSKSFIRPWRLIPEAQRLAQPTKSDPVTLYQNYQKEWKQISFPGENRHADIRWAVREKMLGTDPTPRPILKKSSSTLSVKRR
ncbi:centriolar and ciliogenesis-associated protein HYSL1 [Diachasmimorpha longicaudata]|uniref:centriolar and ciliogenesis-associated protein HYSL1 n=1 Tax=Diachasmimorpha longicaudata TaxID=58733 RepID=UPI0030B86F7F